MRIEVLRTSRPVARHLRRTAVACPLLDVVVVVGTWAGLLLIVARHVIPGWVVSSTLIVATLLRILVGATWRRGERPSSRRPDPRTAVRRPTSRLFVLPAVIAVLGNTLGAADDLISGAAYHVLEPSGPGGCRPVVRETSFLFAGGGDVYAVGPSGLGQRTSSWRSDDGYSPIASHTYELRWGADNGNLSVNGSDVDPFWPAQHEIDCP
jgi:hypothetical protein